nr:putative capsid protein [Poaceae Liege totivirus 16]
MLTEYINSFSRLGVGKAFEPTFGEGRFSIINKSVAHVKMGPNTYTTNLELQTQFQITGTKYGTSHPIATNKYYGYNKRYLDEDGVYDPLRAIDEFSKTVPGLRLNKVDLTALARTTNATDSHEAYIYVMLVSWYKARMYKDMKGSDDKFVVKQSPYTDSHVGMAIHGQFEEKSVEVELGPLYDVEVTDIGWETRDADNFWSKPYVLRYTSTNVAQVTFYLLHTLGSAGQSGLNVDIPIPGIDSHEVLLDGVGGLVFGAFNTDSVPWDKPNIIWLWIMDYVRLNRVEQAFVAALEMLGALSATPMPSYQESALWHKAKTTVNIAKFSPTRARIPSNLVGEPNVYDLNAATITLEEGMAPQNFMVVSAILNYISWVGMYGLVDNFAMDLSDWRDAFISRADELAILGAVEARAALVSFVTGKEIVTCFNNNCFISYDLTPMHTTKFITVDAVYEDGYDPVVRLDAVPAYVSGSLILGAVACDVDSLAHLHSTQTFEVDRYGTATVPDSIKIASIYRLFGHEVLLTHDKSGEVFPVYSNVRDSVVASYEVLARTRPFDMIRVGDSVARKGRHDMIPSAGALYAYGPCHVTIEQPRYDVCGYVNRSAVCRPSIILSSRRKAVVFKVSNTSEFTNAKFQVRNRAGVVRQDFHEVETEPAPAIPVATGLAAITPALRAHQEGEPVIGVE